MGEVVPFRVSESTKQRWLAELQEIEVRIEPDERRAEELRRYLGVLGCEKGLEG